MDKIKEILEKDKKKIILIIVLISFLIGIVVIAINRDKINFLKLMSNSIFDLEKEYSCEEGYIQNGTQCEKEEVINASLNNTCEAGYTYNEALDQCQKEEVVEASNNALCNNGYTYNKANGKCEKLDVANAEVIINCPAGYTRNGNTCEKRTTAKCEFLRYDCDGKGEYKSGNNNFGNGSCGYRKCPTGYSGIGGKCYKLSGGTYKGNEAWVVYNDTQAGVDPKNFSCSKGTLKFGGIYSISSILKEHPYLKNFKSSYTKGRRYVRHFACVTNKTKAMSSCEDGYKTVLNACIKAPIPVYMCGNGYVSNGDGTGTKVETKEATVTNLCGNGYSYNSGTNRCEKLNQTNPINQVIYTCPAGYTQNGTNCHITLTKLANKSYSCDAGYNLEGNVCKKKTIKEATVATNN